MLREHGIDERVGAIQHVENRPVVSDHIADEPDRLLEHRLAQLVAELRKALAIDGVVLLEAPEVEPVAGELGGESARPLVFHHPADLGGEDGVLVQIAGGRMR